MNAHSGRPGNHHARGDRGHQDQTGQQDHAAVAIHQRSIEVPDEARQNANQAGRQQPGGGDRPPIKLRVAQSEGFERLDVERADHLSVADHRLAALVRLHDRRDRLARILLGAQRGVLIQDLVAAHEALDKLDDDGPIGVGEEGTDAQLHAAADLVDPIVGNAVLQDVLQDALGLVGDGRPVEIVEQRQLTSGGVAQRRGAEPGDGLRAIVRGAPIRIAAHHVDGLNQIGQGARLLIDQIAIELDHGRHLGRGGIAGLAGADLADVRALAGRFDGHGRDVAFAELVDPRQQVDAQHDGQQDRGDHADGHSERNPRARTGPRRRGRCGVVHEAHTRGSEVRDQPRLVYALR